MWRLWRKPCPDSAGLVAARKARLDAQSSLLQAKQRAEKVDRVTTRSDELRAHNGFGASLDACMERK